MDFYTEAIARFREVYERAKASNIQEPAAAALATANEMGHPSARMVLLKGFDEAGFVFYTNLESRKGHQIMKNPRVALCFHWQLLEEQVIVEGGVDPVSREEADAYWNTRPRESQIGAWASLQSRPLDQRETLLKRVSAYENEFKDRPVPRPASWSGFRIRPDRIEFWKAGPHRLHERTVYEKTGKSWAQTLLFP